MLRDDLAKSQRERNGIRAALRIPSPVVCPGARNSNASQFYPSRRFGSMIQLHCGFCLGPLPSIPPGIARCCMTRFLGFVMVNHGGTSGVHSGRENVTVTVAARLCLEAGQAWSLFFFPSSSFQGTETPALPFINITRRVLLHSQTAYCWEASCLQKDTCMLYFLRPLPLPGVDKVPQQGQQLH